LIKKIVLCVAIAGWILQPVFAQDNQGSDGQQGSIASQLLSQLQMLKQELLELRGLNEEQAYQLKQIKETQRDHYLDLDRRISGLQGKLAASQATAPATVRPRIMPTNMPVKALMNTKPTTPIAPIVSVLPAVQKPAQQQVPAETQAYNKAYGLVKKKKFAQASKAFEQLLVDYPNGKFSPNAHYWMGELFMVDSDLKNAATAFSTVVSSYPKHWKSADALYKLGEIYFRLGILDKSKLHLDRVVVQFPDSTAARFASRYLRANFPQ